MSQMMERLWQEISTLPLLEQEELRCRLNTFLSSLISEDEFEKVMEAKGMIIRPKPLSASIVEQGKYVPIEYKGKPLSEIIIEERR